MSVGRSSSRSLLLRRVRSRSTVRQHDRTDCGPAALLSVLRYWGGNSSLPAIRELARTGPHGTTLPNLSRAAEFLGFRARGATGSLDDLSSAPLPCIAHLVLDDGSAHFAVVWKVRTKWVDLGDPAKGTRRLSRTDFERVWVHRSVLLLEPSHPLRDDPPSEWWPWLLTHLSRERDWLTQSLFLGVATAGLGLATAFFVQWLIDDLIPRRDSEMILATGAVLILILLIRSGAGYLRQRFLLTLNRRLSLSIHHEFLSHLFSLPLPFFDRRATGDFTTRQSDGIRVQNSILEVLGTSVVDGLIVLGSFAGLFLLAPDMGVLALIAVPAYAILLLRIVPTLRQAHSELLSAHAAVETTLIDALRGIRDLWGFGAAPAFRDRSASSFTAFQEAAQRLGRIQAGATLGSEMIGGTVATLALLGGALLVTREDLRLGQLMAGYSLLVGMLPSIQRLAHTPGLVQEAAVSAGRLRDFLLAASEPPGGSRPLRLREELRLERATVIWDSGEYAMREVDLTLRPGRVAGLSGPNGAGKSTLVAALQGMRPLSGGRYLIDGVPVEHYARDELRRRIALFPAEPALFSGTLAENVLLGRKLGEPRTRLLQFEESGFSSFLERFPEGWRTRVGEGGRRLSTGERQAVGLLRALAGDPALVLVDEGLAGADDDLSGLLLDLLLMMRDRAALLIVSHDPRVLARTDLVYRMEGGRILSTHDPQSILARPRGGRGSRTPTPFQRTSDA